jgi:glycosyltransferase involved in cell wall biosynthesis
VQYRRFNPGSLKSIAGAFSNKPRSEIDTFNAEYAALVQRLASEAPFDCVIASQLGTAPYALLVKDVPRVLEEIEISIYAEQARRASGMVNKARKQLMWSKWRSYMRSVLSQYDGCTVVSKPEIGPILSAVPAYPHITVIPNGADIERFTGDFGTPQRDTLVYTGAMTYYVNFDAMKFFLGEVLPRVQQACPNVRLLMAGRTDGVPLDQLPQNEAATCVGHVADIRRFVVGGWVSVVPERVGGGTRIKLLESMALGTPVVATDWATVGVDVTSGRELLCSDEPVQLADQLVSVLSSASLRDELSRRGQDFVRQKHDWRVIGSQLNSFLEECVQRRHSSKARRYL